MTRLRLALVLVILVGMTSSHPARARAAQDQRPAVNPTAATIADFHRRVDDYMQLQRMLEGRLPKLPKEATPQQIDQNQRALGMLIATARANAKPGDLFTPDMQRLVHRQFAAIFQGQPGQQLRRYIHDEPHPVMPEINKRYPDTIPLSTMPLRVLAQLPRLPEELEYRFVDSHLVLMDVHAHLIVDYILNAIPEASPAKPPKTGAQ
ncbi:MAG TPA: hypothetical protein VL173_08805 [Vicinamibacterales bacterium]|jgi:hypothetical protein|nr:hypothetical protein [Vicinamibacterales bacterium]